MPRTLLHVDGIAGIAGDMALGAVLDLGVPLEALRSGLSSLGVSGFELRSERVVSRGLQATRAQVLLQDPPEGHPHRGLRELLAIVSEAALPARVQERASAVFEALCVAEGAVHGVSPDEVHLHEAGAVDAIVDVVGTCIGLEYLGVDALSCSPPQLGSGTVRCAHGELPVPVPAVLQLLSGKEVQASTLEGELTTPTGAALLVGTCETWGRMPGLTLHSVGLGLGTRELPDRANVVRFLLGEEAAAATAGHAGDDPYLIEADVDDAEPQLLAAACEDLREAGALDVTQFAVTMKKGRVGARLGVLAGAADRDRLVDLLLERTTTIGCRWHRVSRAECGRTEASIETAFGPIRVKSATWKGRVVNRKPEHEDCLAAARKHGVSLKTVADAVSYALSQSEQEPQGS